MFTNRHGMVRANGRELLLSNASTPLPLLFFSMEGGELFNRIRQRHEKPYTEREAAQIILMIAKAVGHLHHMDVVRSLVVRFAVMPVRFPPLGTS